jgi:hypothetical protein
MDIGGTRHGDSENKLRSSLGASGAALPALAFLGEIRLRVLVWFVN